VYGETLVALGAENPRIVVCEADLGKSTMTYAFERAYPDRYFEMGIAEANMTSFAAGLSLTGKVAFTNSFAVFAGGRAYDQIRQGIAIGGLNVKVVGSSAGLSDFGDGATHQSVEDIAIMRAIPNMTVLVPADAPQLRRMVEWMVAYDGPVYLRMSRNDLPEVTGPADSVLRPTMLRLLAA
nr:transketolase family protein [Clostridia bacterium]